MDQTNLHELCIKKIIARGVSLEEIAELTLFLQKPYFKDLTLETCLHFTES
jgi:hypothetical protein